LSEPEARLALEAERALAQSFSLSQRDVLLYCQRLMTSSDFPLAPHDRYVFVYGTLCRGELRDINLLKPAAVFIGRGTVRGLMYDLGHYPGVVLQDDGDDSALVYGEVYAIGPELEQMLDEIEEVWPQQTGEYSKRDAVVSLFSMQSGTNGKLSSGDLAELPCFLYQIEASRILGRQSIAGGNWVTYRHAIQA
jgi:gamma-glutamylcyclotransferase (GGCT)/AIG2-like uncharacterized protein YtfP